MALHTSIEHPSPRPLGPAGHAVMDYLTAGMFLAAGFAWRRRHRQASTLAFVNGVSVLASSMLTDYPGGVARVMSFETHGKLDVALAGMTAAGPMLMGFSGDPEARLFYAQAGLEAGVIAATDFSGRNAAPI